MKIRDLEKLLSDTKMKAALANEAKNNRRLAQEMAKTKRWNTLKRVSPYLLGAILGIKRGLDKHAARQQRYKELKADAKKVNDKYREQRELRKLQRELERLGK